LGAAAPGESPESLEPVPRVAAWSFRTTANCARETGNPTEKQLLRAGSALFGGGRIPQSGQHEFRMSEGGEVQDPAARAALEAYWVECHFSEEALRRYRFQSRRFDSILSFAEDQSFPRNGRSLDVGAGPGSLAVAMNTRFPGEYNLADRFEPPAEMRQALERRGLGPYVRCDLSRPTPFPDVRTDYRALLFVEVLEHLLVNPIELLRELRRVLVDGGFLLLSTPNQSRLRNRWNLLRNRSIRESDAFPPDSTRVLGHVMEYTAEDLRGLLESAGFRVIAHRVVQHLPALAPSRAQRTGSRLLNTAIAQRLSLGDDLLVWAQR